MSGKQAKQRQSIDPVGFAHSAKYLEKVIERIDKFRGNLIREKEKSIDPDAFWRMAICPHDDYTYAGHLYPLALSRIQTPIVILFGVAHKAAQLQLENQLIFDGFSHWEGPYGSVKVSDLREKIMQALPEESFQVNDKMQQLEHSLEAMLPFIQHYNRKVEIVPILVPYMSYERMEKLATVLSTAIAEVVGKENYAWGKDFSLVLTTDAVHYGDQGWGGSDYARFGATDKGYQEALEFEKKLIDECFQGEMTPQKVNKFNEYTVDESDYRKYKWTWCGRYAVPVGLLTGIHLTKLLKSDPLKGIPLDYATTIMHQPIEVADLGEMGITAPANLHHWVGFAAIGFQ